MFNKVILLIYDNYLFRLFLLVKFKKLKNNLLFYINFLSIIISTILSTFKCLAMNK